MVAPVRWFVLAPCSRDRLAHAMQVLVDDDVIDAELIDTLELHGGADGHAALYCRDVDQAWGSEPLAECLSKVLVGEVVAAELSDDGPVIFHCRSGACDDDSLPSISPEALVVQWGLPPLSEAVVVPTPALTAAPPRAACWIDRASAAEVSAALRRAYPGRWPGEALILRAHAGGTTVLIESRGYDYVGSDLSEQLPDAIVYGPKRDPAGVSIYMCHESDYAALWREPGVAAKEFDPPTVLTEIDGATTLTAILARLGIPPEYV